MINLIGILILIVIEAVLILSLITYFIHKLNVKDNELSERDKELAQIHLELKQKNLEIKKLQSELKNTIKINSKRFFKQNDQLYY